MTLLELLLALALLAIAAPLAYRGLDGMLVAGHRSERLMTRWQGLMFGFERIEADVAQALVRPVRAGDGTGLKPWLGDSGGFEFTRWRDDRPPQRLRYFFKDGALRLQQWPVPERGQQAAPEAMVLIDGVSELDFYFLDAVGKRQATWGDGAALPVALGLEMTLESGERITRLWALP